jgi:cobyrinic acid a,c-diamide synthase
MGTRLTLGYREATTTVPSPLGPAGAAVRGHEFHYSTIEPVGDALAMTGRNGATVAGFASSTMLASYLHVHLATRPDLAERFVQAARVGGAAIPR